MMPAEASADIDTTFQLSIDTTFHCPCIPFSHFSLVCTYKADM